MYFKWIMGEVLPGAKIRLCCWGFEGVSAGTALHNTAWVTVTGSTLGDDAAAMSDTTIEFNASVSIAT